MVTNISDVTTIGERYILQERLGAGGMGQVYRAVDRLNKREVALKRVLVNPRHLDRDASNLILSHEFQTLASLRHPNVIGVMDYGFENAKQPYFTMSLVEPAQTLRQAVQGQPFIHRIKLIMQVLQALVYIHRHGIIHRDLKPENALVTSDGQVKVLDFGLAGAREEAAGDALVGTIQYMAPEVITGDSATRAADLYAVGVMLYEILAGKHPFGTGAVHEVLGRMLRTEPDMTPIEDFLLGRKPYTSDSDTAETQPLNELSTVILTPEPFAPLPDLAPTLWQDGNSFISVVRRLLARDPKVRYSDAQHVIHELNTALGLPPDEQPNEIRESFLQAAKFVGREREYRNLNNALENAIDNRGSLWIIGGESGVGKSRLINELRTLAMIRGVLVLRGQAVSEAGQPYQLWQEPLRRILLSVETSDNETSVLKQIIPDIDQLLARLVENAPELEGAESEQRLLTTIVGVFEKYLANHENGILLILEDLQWASKSLDVLHALTPKLSRNALLVVGSYREDEAPELPQQLPESQVIRLQRLDPQEIISLSHAMLGDAGRKPQVVTLLQRETEGNVFFLIEVIRALAEEAGQLDLIGEMTLPAQVFSGGVQRIVQRRLEKVPRAYRPLLKLAAVMGRQIDLAVLAQSAQGVEVDDWLTTCVNVSVVDSQDGQWRFAHDKLREQLLNDMPREEQRHLHEQAGEAIEHAHKDTLENHAVALAYHWSHTDKADKELFYSRIAGEQAADASDYREAKRYFERALALSENATDRVDLQILLSDMYQLLGEYESASQLLQIALSGAGNRRQRAKALLTLTWIDIREGTMDRGAERAADALTEARASDDQKLLAQALYVNAVIHLIKGEYPSASGYLGEALPLARAANDKIHIADVLNALGAVEEGLGHHDKAEAYLTEAVTLAKETGHRFVAANAQGNLSRLAYSQGQYALSLERCEATLTLFQDIGNIYGEATILYFLGFNHIALGNYSTGESYLKQSIRLSMEIGALTVTLIALCGAARLQTLNGHKTEAVELLGMIFHHPASEADVDIHKEGDPLLETLRNELTAPEFDAAIARGQALDFEAWTNEYTQSASI